MHPLLHRCRRAVLLAVLVAAILAVSAVPAAVAAQQYHGAQTHPLWGGVSADEYERELALLAEAGADSVRIDLGWSSIESDGKGRINSWYVKRADAFFERARAHGLKVIASLSDSPCWASSSPDRGDCSGSWWNRGVQKWAPSNASDYGDAAGWVAARWHADLAAIEVWNEPNDSAYFRANDPVADYARVVKAAYGPIKAAAPDVPVVVGAVSHSDRSWLERLYDQGIAGNYDGLSIHPYNEWRDPDDPWQPQWKAYSFLSGVKWIRELMVSKGDSDKGLWLTEFGFSTCGTADKVCVSQEQQAEYTRDSFKIASGWSYVRAAIVYNLRNIDDTPNNRLSQFGLVNRDFSRKPAFAAFKQAMHDYYGPNAQAQPDPDAAGSPSGSDSGSGDGESGVPVRGGFVSVVSGGGSGGTLVATASGKTRVKLTCKAKRGRRCKGRLSLRLAGSKTKLGQTKFAIKPGKRIVTVKLNAAARRRIARAGQLRVSAVVAPTGTSARARAARRSFVLARV